MDLSDRNLMFQRNHPLKVGAVMPIRENPLVIRPGEFTKIVMDQITSPDGKEHHIMLIGTASGWLQKAVMVELEDRAEGHIIEELQLLEDPLPIQFVQLSNETGQLYAGTSKAVVQVDIQEYRHNTSCVDCILAGDPY